MADIPPDQSCGPTQAQAPSSGTPDEGATVAESVNVAAAESEPQHDYVPARAAAPASSSAFSSAIGWTILGAIIPGVGLWRAGHRVVGPIITGVFVVLVGGLAVTAIVARDDALAFATQPANLMIIAVALMGVGLAWVVVIGASHLALRPAYPSPGRRIAGAVVVGVLSLAVITPVAFGADLSYTLSTTVSTIFAETPTQDESSTVPQLPEVDPWANKPRLNVLILGGDYDPNYSGNNGSRTDSVILASIDTKTGSTTLFSLPRQTARMPFPSDSPLHRYFPYGWYDGRNGTNPNYFLNAMFHLLPYQVPKNVLGKTPYLGEDALKLSVGEALGLKVDYFVYVSMDGFKNIINALGGITINVNYKVPINGQTTGNIPPTGWINPGPNQHLDGYHALWYARGRYGLDDYSRMERQRCVINAVAQQAQPSTLLLRYEKVASAAKQTIITDIPQSALPALVTLAERVQGTTMRSIVFQNGKDGFATANPNWPKVRSQVQTALKETAKTNKTPVATPTPGTTASPSSKPTSSPKGSTKAPSSVSLDDACAYNPHPYNSGSGG